MGDDYTIEIKGALRSDVRKYMIDLPPYEKTLAGLSETLDLEIEIIASDPNDEEFEYYHYVKGTLVASFDLPVYIPAFMLEEYDISDEDKRKYEPLDGGGLVVKKEYLPDAEWNEDRELLCKFAIKMENREECTPPFADGRLPSPEELGMPDVTHCVAEKKYLESLLSKYSEEQICKMIGMTSDSAVEHVSTEEAAETILEWYLEDGGLAIMDFQSFYYGDIERFKAFAREDVEDMMKKIAADAV